MTLLQFGRSGVSVTPHWFDHGVGIAPTAPSARRRHRVLRKRIFRRSSPSSRMSWSEIWFRFRKRLRKTLIPRNRFKNLLRKFPKMRRHFSGRMITKTKTKFRISVPRIPRRRRTQRWGIICWIRIRLKISRSRWDLECLLDRVEAVMGEGGIWISIPWQQVRILRSSSRRTPRRGRVSSTTSANKLTIPSLVNTTILKAPNFQPWGKGLRWSNFRMKNDNNPSKTITPDSGYSPPRHQLHPRPSSPPWGLDPWSGRHRYNSHPSPSPSLPPHPMILNPVIRGKIAVPSSTWPIENIVAAPWVTESTPAINRKVVYPNPVDTKLEPSILYSKLF